LASDLFTTAAQDWRNAWVEASETGDLSFKTLIDNMKKRIVMFLADAAFIKLTEALADAFGINISGKTAGSGGGGGSSSGGGSSGGGLGGLIDKGVDFVKGLFGFAEGGYVAGNKSVIVGERGPEIFTPASSGSIIPNFAGMGGGATQVTYNINAVDSASFVEMLSEQPEIIHSLVMDQDSRMFSRRL
jgi:phage-related minor tail protein